MFRWQLRLVILNFFFHWGSTNKRNLGKATGLMAALTEASRNSGQNSVIPETTSSSGKDKRVADALIWISQMTALMQATWTKASCYNQQRSRTTTNSAAGAFWNDDTLNGSKFPKTDVLERRVRLPVEVFLCSWLKWQKITEVTKYGCEKPQLLFNRIKQRFELSFSQLSELFKAS